MEKHFVVETLLPACKRERVDCLEPGSERPNKATGFAARAHLSFTQESKGIKKICYRSTIFVSLLFPVLHHLKDI